jgi:ABC-type glycerol-3-phosphate transport system substrate-binding protein
MDRCWLVCIVLLGSLVFAGCGNEKEDDQKGVSGKASPDVTLNILVVDAPSIAQTAGRRWSAEGMGDAKFTEMSSKELAEKNFELDPSIDVIVYPSEYMADLVSATQLMPIPKKYRTGDTVNPKEILEHQNRFLMRYGSEVYSLPLGDVYLMLVYNKKVFEELKLEVPATWSEYATVAEKLRSAGHAVQEPLAEGWASRTLLSRAASHVRSRGQVSTVFEINSMKPLLESEPFPRVFEEMKSALGEDVDASLTPADVFRNLLSGQTAMGLTWPSKHFVGEDAPINEDLVIASLPGAREWYNRQETKWQKRDQDASIRIPLLGSTGLVASVNKSSGFATTAIDFATWICSKQTSTSVSIESPKVSMYRATHLGLPSRWAGDKISPDAVEQFAEVVREISEANLVLLFPRIPGQSQYLAALDEQVVLFAKGEVQAKQALSATAEQWDKISERLNRAEQVKKLRRSEGFYN